MHVDLKIFFKLSGAKFVCNRSITCCSK